MILWDKPVTLISHEKGGQIQVEHMFSVGLLQ